MIMLPYDDGMRKKLLIVLAGYACALLAAIASVYLNELWTPPAVAQASSGMLACGDVILFCIVFCAIAIPTTVFLIIAIATKRSR
jgi:hypothetical protein